MLLQIAPTSRSGASRVVLYMHGNGEDVGQIAAMLDKYADLWNAVVVAVEYPGYGCCGGQPSEQSINAAVSAALDYVERRFAGSELILCGRSVGTGPMFFVSERACDSQSVRLVLIVAVSAFKTLKDVVRRRRRSGACFRRSLAELAGVRVDSRRRAGVAVAR